MVKNFTYYFHVLQRQEREWVNEKERVLSLVHSPDTHNTESCATGPESQEFNPGL